MSFIFIFRTTLIGRFVAAVRRTAVENQTVALSVNSPTTLPSAHELVPMLANPISPLIGQAIHETTDDSERSRPAFGSAEISVAVPEPENLRLQVLKTWSAGGRCTWPGCASKALFKTRALLVLHLTNIHASPLLCLAPHCEWKTPFGKDSDLKRHQLTAHSRQRAYICEVTSCDALIKEFARKDHLIKHMRERHDNYYCPMNHCPRGTGESFATPEKAAMHVQEVHGGAGYECALGACAQRSLSKFFWDSLWSHLRSNHGFPYDGATYMRNKMIGRGDRTLIEADLNPLTTWRDCKICANKGQRR
jgi:hypothetical protein